MHFDDLFFDADVLVLGGGMAGAWAAHAAAREGASVVLVDKGCCGTSGVTAAAGPGHWWVAPPERDAAVAERARAAQGLAEPAWMHRILEATWDELPGLAPHYRFPVGPDGRTVYHALRGPEYGRALRERLDADGVRVLDHHPALELLLHEDASVAGARGLALQAGGRWRVRAGATVVATGGCAFLSKLLGADNNTGDGALMAAEAGAELSGMEFTSAYCVAPAGTSMTRSMSYVFADYFDADGRPLHIGPGADFTPQLARALLQGPVWCTLARMPADLRAQLTAISPNVMLPFTRRGIDPFTQRFEVTLRGEGTVRGIGGLRVESADCETAVHNLFAAGDAASRERVTGAISGGGAVNSAWALASGLWAGRAAARRTRREGRRSSGPVVPAGQAALRPQRAAAHVDRAGVVALVQRAMLDLDRNLFRHGDALAADGARLDAAWRELSAHGQAPDDDPRAVLRLRETAALLANARWSKAAALARAESRGMHQRLDAPQPRPELAHRLVTGGLHRVWRRADPVAQAAAEALA